jgi:hypothetical protein
MVYEDVIAGLAADKPITLFVVKPLYCALFFHFSLFVLLILQWQVDHLYCLALLRGIQPENTDPSASAGAFMKS